MDDLSFNFYPNICKMLKMRYFALFFIAALVLRPSYALPVNSNGQCDDEQYGCGLNGGGPCIPLEWACDNVKDCANGRVSALIIV